MAHENEMRLIRQARMKLMGQAPFFGDLAFSLPIEFSDQLNPPTAATDGMRIIYHPEFITKLPSEELVWVVAHEVMHPALLHTLRRGNRDPKRWNIACDIVVNYLLATSRVGKEWPNAVREDDLYRKGGGKVEKIYELLPEDYDKDPMDDVGDTDPKDADNLAADMRNKLQQAMQTAKKAGNMSSDLEAFIENITTPKVRWQDHVRNFVMTTRGTDRTYAKLNRRHAGTNVILPGSYGEKMGGLGCGLDCSGSTSDEMVSQFGSEMQSIQEELCPEYMHAIYFDHEVKKMETFEADDPITLKVYGRGGTCFRSVFEYIEKNQIELESLIMMTDLECDDYGPEPPYPVLWLGVGPYAKEYAKSVPWGQVVLVE